MKKRLIICYDGTWNNGDNGDNPTNVIKLSRAIRPADDHGVHQIVFYDTGVGTGTNKFDQIVGGAFGVGLTQNIWDGYRFLANNYELGDEISLFGFSRGAFTARSLVGLVSRVGLIEKRKMHLLDEAWDFYKESVPGDGKPLAEEIDQNTRKNIRIKCIGVWDTVGSLGVPGEVFQLFNRGKFEFHDTQLGDNVDYALHAVAIDEKRGPFAPTLWEAPAGTNRSNVEQVWFTGVHSNIGGSYEDHGLSDIALDWMIQRTSNSEICGISYDDAYIDEHVKPNAMGTHYESRKLAYTTSKFLPFLRNIGQTADTAWWHSILKSRTNRPNKEDNQFINEMIHRSAIERFGKSAKFNDKQVVYEPDNLKSAIGKLPVVEWDGSITQPG